MHRVLRWLVAASAALFSLTACTGDARMHGAGDGGADAPLSDSPFDGQPATDGATLGNDGSDPDPVFSADEWAALQALSPTRLPDPPPDPTNRLADDPAAARLGQRLFFDPGFSGQLLSTDNDGSAQALGRANATSGDTGRVACAACHVPAGGFSDTRSFQRQVSLGAGWGARRAPSLLDVGQARLIMWDGRRDSLFSQVFGPLESVAEMNSSRLYMAQQLYQRYRAEYESVFGPMPLLDDTSRFPSLAANVTGCIPQNRTEPAPVCNGPFHGMPGDHAEFDRMTEIDQQAITTVVVNAGKALGAYQRLLSCGLGPFDDWMHGGQQAISRAAQRGAAIFVGRGGCVTCHSGPFMSDQRFHNVGLVPAVVQQFILDAHDRGAAVGIASLITDPLNSSGAFSDGTDTRLPFPGAVTSAMEGAFRTPMLRCVNMRPSWMHTGQLQSLEAVVAFFNRGGDAPGGGYPGMSELHALGLSPRDQGDLTAFLRTLDGPGAPTELRSPPAM
ncbi:MAG: cytochrome c peroxidase [Myxococcales bacterium]